MRYVLHCLAILACCAGCNQSAPDADAAAEIEKKALLKYYREQVQQYPDSAGLRMQMLNVMDSLALYDEALAQTDSLIRRDSLNNGLWFRKAALYEGKKDTGNAILSYKRAIAIYPSIESQLSLANLYAEKKDPQALAICESILRLGLGRETDAHANFIAGVYYARTGNYKLANTQFDQCINNNYTYMEAYMEKGFLEFDSKRYNEAVRIFEQAITVNNTYADAYYWRAKCQEGLGNKQAAIVDYQRALGLDKELREAADALERLK